MSLLSFGFTREHCQKNNIDLFPNDIIELFMLWLSFCDKFDPDLCDNYIEIKTQTHDKYGEYQQAMLQDYQYAHCSAICHNVIKKEIKHSGHFKLEEEDLQTPP